MGLGRKMTGKMPFVSHHIKVHAVDMTDHSPCSPWSPSVGDICQVLYHRILLLSLPFLLLVPSPPPSPVLPFHPILSAGVPMHSPHWRDWELSCTSWGQIIYIHYLELLLTGAFLFSPHLFIYSIIRLCQCGLINSYIALWAIMQYEGLYLVSSSVGPCVVHTRPCWGEQDAAGLSLAQSQDQLFI